MKKSIVLIPLPSLIKNSFVRSFDHQHIGSVRVYSEARSRSKFLKLVKGAYAH